MASTICYSCLRRQLQYPFFHNFRLFAYQRSFSTNIEKFPLLRRQVPSLLNQNRPTMLRFIPSSILSGVYRKAGAFFAYSSSSSSPDTKDNFVTKIVLSPQVSTTSSPLTPRPEPQSITITPAAAHRLHQLMAEEQDPQLCLRVQVESGGCHGFQYQLSLASTRPPSLDRNEDTLFTAVQHKDDGADTALPPPPTAGGDSNGNELGHGLAKVVMDRATLDLLSGSSVDYTRELIGSQFKVVDNPRATSSCGCGTSFDLKSGGGANGAWGF